MKKIISMVLLFFLLSTFNLRHSISLPAEDIQPVTDARHFDVAKKMIQEAKSSIRVMMYEMVHYNKHPNSPSNILMRELIDAKKRGVKVEVILEVREGEDRTTKNNRHSGKILSEGGLEVIYDLLLKTTHAKLMVVDMEVILLGSANWTFAGLTKNNEVSVLIRSKEVAKELIDYFNRVKATGTKSQKKE